MASVFLKKSLKNGSEIQVIESNERIILKQVAADPTLEELLAQVTDENRHEAYFSKPIGRELM